MSENHSLQQKQHETIIAPAITWAIATASFLTIIKFVVALLTHSMAIMASTLDSAMDAAASFINYIAAKQATEPPDEEHTYGHEKIESLAGLIQSLLILVSGLFLITEATRRFFFGSYVEVIPLGIAVIAFSMVVSLILVWRLAGAARKTKSMILDTEKLHYSMDILNNLGIILALVLVRLTGNVIWDLAISVVISLYIFKSAYDIMRKAVDELLDRSLPQTAISEIESLIFSHHSSIVGFHDFRSHRVGRKIFLDFHIEIAGVKEFRRAHEITESLIPKIQERYPNADVTIHYDPEGEV